MFFKETNHFEFVETPMLPYPQKSLAPVNFPLVTKTKKVSKLSAGRKEFQYSLSRYIDGI